MRAVVWARFAAAAYTKTFGGLENGYNRKESVAAADDLLEEFDKRWEWNSESNAWLERLRRKGE